jgi:hypothetical protein
LQRERDHKALLPLLSPQADVRVSGVVKFESSTRSDDAESQEKVRSLATWLDEVRDVPLFIAGQHSSTGRRLRS